MRLHRFLCTIQNPESSSNHSHICQQKFTSHATAHISIDNPIILRYSNAQDKDLDEDGHSLPHSIDTWRMDVFTSRAAWAFVNALAFTHETRLDGRRHADVRLQLPEDDFNQSHTPHAGTHFSDAGCRATPKTSSTCYCEAFRCSNIARCARTRAGSMHTRARCTSRNRYALVRSCSALKSNTQGCARDMCAGMRAHVSFLGARVGVKDLLHLRYDGVRDARCTWSIHL